MPGKKRITLAILLFMGPAACVFPPLKPDTAPSADAAAAPEQMEEVDPDDPDEKFAREWFYGGEYLFLIMNRAKVKGVTVTRERGLLLDEPAHPGRLSYSARLLRELHDTTLGALDPGRGGLSGSQWWTDRRLSAPRWEGEVPLKVARNQFYAAIRKSLSSQQGPRVERVQMMLAIDWEPQKFDWQSALDPTARSRKLRTARKDPATGSWLKSAACVVIEDDQLHTPANYLAYLAGVDAAQVQPIRPDERSVRVLDVKLQEYFCQVEALPAKERPGLFVGSANLYRNAVTRYLDRREDSKGQLAGLDFIKQYLAATIIGSVQRESNELNLPVGLFVEFKVGKMDEADGGRRYVLHRLVKEEDGQCLLKAMREAVGLLEQRTRGAKGDVLALKLQAAQQFSADPRRRESVRVVFKKIVDSAAVLMPAYTQTALAGVTPAAVAVESSKQDDCLSLAFVQRLRQQEAEGAAAAPAGQKQPSPPTSAPSAAEPKG